MSSTLEARPENESPFIPPKQLHPLATIVKEKLISTEYIALFAGIVAVLAIIGGAVKLYKLINFTRSRNIPEDW